MNARPKLQLLQLHQSPLSGNSQRADGRWSSGTAQLSAIRSTIGRDDGPKYSPLNRRGIDAHLKLNGRKRPACRHCLMSPFSTVLSTLLMRTSPMTSAAPSSHTARVPVTRAIVIPRRKSLSLSCGFQQTATNCTDEYATTAPYFCVAVLTLN